MDRHNYQQSGRKPQHQQYTATITGGSHNQQDRKRAGPPQHNYSYSDPSETMDTAYASKRDKRMTRWEPGIDLGKGVGKLVSIFSSSSSGKKETSPRNQPLSKQQAGPSRQGEPSRQAAATQNYHPSSHSGGGLGIHGGQLGRDSPAGSSRSGGYLTTDSSSGRNEQVGRGRDLRAVDPRTLGRAPSPLSRNPPTPPNARGAQAVSGRDKGKGLAVESFPARTVGRSVDPRANQDEARGRNPPAAVMPGRQNSRDPSQQIRATNVTARFDGGRDTFAERSTAPSWGRPPPREQSRPPAEPGRQQQGAPNPRNADSLPIRDNKNVRVPIPDIKEPRAAPLPVPKGDERGRDPPNVGPQSLGSGIRPEMDPRSQGRGQLRGTGGVEQNHARGVPPHPSVAKNLRRNDPPLEPEPARAKDARLGQPTELSRTEAPMPPHLMTSSSHGRHGSSSTREQALLPSQMERSHGTRSAEKPAQRPTPNSLADKERRGLGPSSSAPSKPTEQLKTLNLVKGSESTTEQARAVRVSAYKPTVVALNTAAGSGAQEQSQREPAPRTAKEQRDAPKIGLFPRAATSNGPMKAGTAGEVPMFVVSPPDAPSNKPSVGREQRKASSSEERTRPAAAIVGENLRGGINARDGQTRDVSASAPSKEMVQSGPDGESRRDVSRDQRPSTGPVSNPPAAERSEREVLRRDHDALPSGRRDAGANDSRFSKRDAVQTETSGPSRAAAPLPPAQLHDRNASQASHSQDTSKNERKPSQPFTSIEDRTAGRENKRGHSSRPSIYERQGTFGEILPGVGQDHLLRDDSRPNKTTSAVNGLNGKGKDVVDRASPLAKVEPQGERSEMRAGPSEQRNDLRRKDMSGGASSDCQGRDHRSPDVKRENNAVKPPHSKSDRGSWEQSEEPVKSRHTPSDDMKMRVPQNQSPAAVSTNSSRQETPVPSKQARPTRPQETPFDPPLEPVFANPVPQSRHAPPSLSSKAIQILRKSPPVSDNMPREQPQTSIETGDTRRPFQAQDPGVERTRQTERNKDLSRFEAGKAVQSSQKDLTLDAKSRKSPAAAEPERGVPELKQRNFVKPPHKSSREENTAAGKEELVSVPHPHLSSADVPLSSFPIPSAGKLPQDTAEKRPARDWFGGWGKKTETRDELGSFTDLPSSQKKTSRTARLPDQKALVPETRDPAVEDAVADHEKTSKAAAGTGRDAPSAVDIQPPFPSTIGLPSQRSREPTSRSTKSASKQLDTNAIEIQDAIAPRLQNERPSIDNAPAAAEMRQMPSSHRSRELASLLDQHVRNDSKPHDTSKSVAFESQTLAEPVRNQDQVVPSSSRGLPPNADFHGFETPFRSDLRLKATSQKQETPLFAGVSSPDKGEPASRFARTDSKQRDVSSPDAFENQPFVDVAQQPGRQDAPARGTLPTIDDQKFETSSRQERQLQPGPNTQHGKIIDLRPVAPVKSADITGSKANRKSNRMASMYGAGIMLGQKDLPSLPTKNESIVANAAEEWYLSQPKDSQRDHHQPLDQLSVQAENQAPNLQPEITIRPETTARDALGESSNVTAPQLTERVVNFPQPIDRSVPFTQPWVSTPLPALSQRDDTLSYVAKDQSTTISSAEQKEKPGARKRPGFALDLSDDNADEVYPSDLARPDMKFSSLRAEDSPRFDRSQFPAPLTVAPQIMRENPRAIKESGRADPMQWSATKRQDELGFQRDSSSVVMDNREQPRLPTTGEEEEEEVQKVVKLRRESPLRLATSSKLDNFLGAFAGKKESAQATDAPLSDLMGYYMSTPDDRVSDATAPEISQPKDLPQKAAVPTVPSMLSRVDPVDEAEGKAKDTDSLSSTNKRSEMPLSHRHTRAEITTTPDTERPHHASAVQPDENIQPRDVKFEQPLESISPAMIPEPAGNGPSFADRLKLMAAKMAPIDDDRSEVTVPFVLEPVESGHKGRSKVVKSDENQVNAPYDSEDDSSSSLHGVPTSFPVSERTAQADSQHEPMRDTPANNATSTMPRGLGGPESHMPISHASFKMTGSSDDIRQPSSPTSCQSSAPRTSPQTTVSPPPSSPQMGHSHPRVRAAFEPDNAEGQNELPPPAYEEVVKHTTRDWHKDDKKPDGPDAKPWAYRGHPALATPEPEEAASAVEPHHEQSSLESLSSMNIDLATLHDSSKNAAKQEHLMSVNSQPTNYTSTPAAIQESEPESDTTVDKGGSITSAEDPFDLEPLGARESPRPDKAQVLSNQPPTNATKQPPTSVHLQTYSGTSEAPDLRPMSMNVGPRGSPVLTYKDDVSELPVVRESIDGHNDDYSVADEPVRPPSRVMYWVTSQHPPTMVGEEEDTEPELDAVDAKPTATKPGFMGKMRNLFGKSDRETPDENVYGNGREEPAEPSMFQPPLESPRSFVAANQDDGLGFDAVGAPDRDIHQPIDQETAFSHIQEDTDRRTPIHSTVVPDHGINTKNLTGAADIETPLRSPTVTSIQDSSRPQSAAGSYLGSEPEVQSLRDEPVRLSRAENPMRIEVPDSPRLGEVTPTLASPVEDSPLYKEEEAVESARLPLNDSPIQEDRPLEPLVTRSGRFRDDDQKSEAHLASDFQSGPDSEDEEPIGSEIQSRPMSSYDMTPSAASPQIMARDSEPEPVLEDLPDADLHGFEANEPKGSSRPLSPVLDDTPQAETFIAPEPLPVDDLQVGSPENEDIGPDQLEDMNIPVATHEMQEQPLEIAPEPQIEEHVPLQEELPLQEGPDPIDCAPLEEDMTPLPGDDDFAEPDLLDNDPGMGDGEALPSADESFPATQEPILDPEPDMDDGFIDNGDAFPPIEPDDGAARDMEQPLIEAEPDMGSGFIGEDNAFPPMAPAGDSFGGVDEPLMAPEPEIDGGFVDDAPFDAGPVPDDDFLAGPEDAFSPMAPVDESFGGVGEPFTEPEPEMGGGFVDDTPFDAGLGPSTDEGFVPDECAAPEFPLDDGFMAAPQEDFPNEFPPDDEFGAAPLDELPGDFGMDDEPPLDGDLSAEPVGGEADDYYESFAVDKDPGLDLEGDGMPDADLDIEGAPIDDEPEEDINELGSPIEDRDIVEKETNHDCMDLEDGENGDGDSQGTDGEPELSDVEQDEDEDEDENEDSIASDEDLDDLDNFIDDGLITSSEDNAENIVEVDEPADEEDASGDATDEEARDIDMENLYLADVPSIPPSPTSVVSQHDNLEPGGDLQTPIDGEPVPLSDIYMHSPVLPSFLSPTMSHAQTEEDANADEDDEDLASRPPVRMSMIYRQSIDCSGLLLDFLDEVEDKEEDSQQSQADLLTVEAPSSERTTSGLGISPVLSEISEAQTPGAASPLSPRPLATPPPDFSDATVSPKGPRTFEEMDLGLRPTSPPDSEYDVGSGGGGQGSSTGRRRTLSQRVSGWWAGGAGPSRAQGPPPMPTRPYDSRFGEEEDEFI